MLVRQRVLRDGRKKEDIKGGRQKARLIESLKFWIRIIKLVAETRVARKHPNMEFINSYYVAQDSLRHWYKVILADPESTGNEKR